MDKLELKHLAPYLPHELKYKGTYGGVSTLRKLEYCNRYNEETDSYTAEIGVDGYLIQYIKPILRPLSDIISHSIFKQIVNSYDNINTTANGVIGFYIDDRYEYQVNYFPYDVVEILFENHFDIFGLIDAGLAIDINTLNK